MIVLTRISGGLAPSLAFRFVSFFLILLLCCFERVVAEVDSEFKSRPDLYPPVFTVEQSVPHKLSPGYIFLGPYEADNSGPYIYDTEGVGIIVNSVELYRRKIS
jgi:hypothetical protein